MILTALTALVVAVAIILGIRNMIKANELRKREVALDNYSAILDERANRLAANEQSCDNLMRSFNKMYLDFQNQGIFTASYTETDSDTMRYSEDWQMVANAKKHLAQTIAHDIIKRYDVKEERTHDGRRRFSHRFKIAEQ